MSLDWSAIETAVKAAVVAATGLSPSLVMWEYQAYQGGNRPQGHPFLTLRFGPSVPVGIDGVYTTTDLTRSAGEEVRISTMAPRQITLTVQCFGGTVTGATSSLALLSRLRERLALPSVRNTLRAAGVSPFGPGAVMYVPAIEGTKFESRSVLEVRCYVDASEYEYAGYIDTVDLTGEYTTSLGTFIGTFTATIGD